MAGQALNDTRYPMRFAAYPGLVAQSPDCAGCVVIVGQGVITADTAVQLQTFLNRWGGDPQRAILRLHSPGGHLVGGLKLGRAIRSAGLATEALSGRPCQSACAYAFLGGTAWAAQARALGLHDYAAGRTEPREGALTRTGAISRQAPMRKILDAVVRGYLRDMGADEAIHAQTLRLASSEMQFIGDADLRRLGIRQIAH